MFGCEFRGLKVVPFKIKVKVDQKIMPFEIKVKIGKQKCVILRKWHKLIDKLGTVLDASQQKCYLQVTIADQYENLISPLKARCRWGVNINFSVLAFM